MEGVQMNHSGDATKMVRECVSNEQVIGEATPNEELRRQILSQVVPKNEREWWAASAIERLELELNAAHERIKHLRDGIAKQNQTIEQACGKVLGYPWFKDDQKNFPGSTEKDGVCVGVHVAETIVSELASRYTESLARIQRLVEAGDRMADLLDGGVFMKLAVQWHEAKEDKP
jgi:hypothetical protein